MRIWDVDPGYLNDRSLLGEHRELHGIYSILLNGKKGYSRHPETLRWKSRLPALAARHDALIAEMQLRGFSHRSPLGARNGVVVWPGAFINPPGEQFAILRKKYEEKGPGRIPLPSAPQPLWAHHKYSVMARSPGKYKDIGPEAAAGAIGFHELAEVLTELLREKPASGCLRNALHHMWGYVKKFAEKPVDLDDSGAIFRAVVKLARRHRVLYLLHSTALGEFGRWLGGPDGGRSLP